MQSLAAEGVSASGLLFLPTQPTSNGASSRVLMSLYLYVPQKPTLDVWILWNIVGNSRYG